MSLVEDNAELLLDLLHRAGSANVEAINSASAVTISDPAQFSTTVLTLNAATPAITLPAPAAGKRKKLYLVQDGTGSRVPTWASASGSVIWLTGGAPTLQTSAASVDVVSFESYDGVNWYGNPGPAQPAAGSFTSIAASGNASITGTLAVAGHVGFNGASVVGKSSAYTKTYSTSVRTVPNATYAGVSLTSSQNATAAATDLTTSEALANALKTSYNAAQVDIAALNTALAALAADVLELKKVEVALVTDLQAVGIAG